MSSTLILWRLMDGKPGHEKQSLALVQGLQCHRECEVFDIAIEYSGAHYLKHVFSNQPIFDASLPSPDYLIGAGHKTHLPMLVARRRHGGKAVVIMNPSLPACLFDHIITPAHDNFKASSKRIICTPSLAPALDSHPDPQRGLIVLGGVSKHYEWEDERLVQQIETLCAHYPNVHWKLSTSRRTPESALQKLLLINRENLDVFDVAALPKSWLDEEYETAGHIWITVDSVSMLAEALNTKARVGMLNLQGGESSTKMQRFRQTLLSSGWVGDCSGTELKEGPIRSQPVNAHLSVARSILESIQK
ncbi:ELM1/GtrOC1 family putative glycosyltransferase [Marinibactrum halimedae]|uniref:Nucleoside-diphosphate sugar epimerase n=1 Tax=Marinibactrum halimedae TaxID=1444977 RepID=A0AA37T505_9GAMM|nr:ELM1/GtrOC1 family putative glycosyltransferase [Marinibactrum halimedae]MCD9460462.1 mitochondrial fission ELM1 family protein [Marinibactrum halimedae]GLS25869.1 nucleoside-diphosphate sugar epimerase [Marinibactrum halimedae]